MIDLLVRNVRLNGQAVDVLARDGVVEGVGPMLRPTRNADVIDGAGHTVLPGLHDHHIHLLATAAASASVAVGPAEVRDDHALATALRQADAGLARGRWLRAVGYHESTAGALDRSALDAIVPHRPVRVQHRSGSLWILNSAALRQLDLAVGHPGIEVDERGRPTGVLHRADDWLRDQIKDDTPLDLAALGTQLASCGITGVTDATPFQSPGGPAILAEASRTRSLPQRLVVMGGLDLLDVTLPAPLWRGPVKIVIDDRAYPPLDALAADIGHVHAHNRSVAIHCVTRTALVLALAALEMTGRRPGDRIEHGSVIPHELLPKIARYRLTVVTQPSFVAERGDQYLAEVEAEDLPYVYPCRTLLDAGIEVAGSSDAPYTAVDPWASMRAAATRRTSSGRHLLPDEAIPPMRALELYLADPRRPGGPSRLIAPGNPADMVLVDGDPWSSVEHLDRERVTTTIVGGQRIF